LANISSLNTGSINFHKNNGFVYTLLIDHEFFLVLGTNVFQGISDGNLHFSVIEDSGNISCIFTYRVLSSYLGNSDLFSPQNKPQVFHLINSETGILIYKIYVCFLMAEDANVHGFVFKSILQ